MTVAQGPAPSNTGPLNSMVEVLASGWDSIYLSFRGELLSGAVAYLGELKSSAALNGDGEPIEIAGTGGIVQGQGRGRYPYVIRCPGFDLQVTGSPNLPPVYCQIRSELLHADGVEHAATAATAAAGFFLTEGFTVVVSRGDPYSDFIGWIPSESDLGRFVNRSRRRTAFFDEAEGHFERRQFTGFRFGRGDLMARLYDKSQEIKSSGKVWLWDLWGEKSARETVWRLEFQLRRKVLKEFSIGSLNDLLVSERDLWDYSTQWLSLRDPSANQQPYRWPVSATWIALAGSRATKPPQGLIRGQLRQHREDRLIASIGGLLTSWAALKGISQEEVAMGRAGLQLKRQLAKRGVSFESVVKRKSERLVEL